MTPRDDRNAYKVYLIAPQQELPHVLNTEHKRPPSARSRTTTSTWRHARSAPRNTRAMSASWPWTERAWSPMAMRSRASFTTHIDGAY